MVRQTQSRQIKLVFLFSFIDYMEYRDELFMHSSGIFVVCISSVASPPGDPLCIC